MVKIAEITTEPDLALILPEIKLSKTKTLAKSGLCC
jgi:hypothetical protein